MEWEAKIELIGVIMLITPLVLAYIARKDRY